MPVRTLYTCDSPPCTQRVEKLIALTIEMRAPNQSAREVLRFCTVDHLRRGLRQFASRFEPANVSWRLRKRMLDEFSRTDRKCALCGEVVNEGEEHVDHIHEIAAGGTSAGTNLRIVHAKCNKKRPQSFACPFCYMPIRWSQGGRHLNDHIIKPDPEARKYYQRYKGFFLYAHISNGAARVMYVDRNGIHHPVDVERFAPLVRDRARQVIEDDYHIIVHWFDLVERNDVVHPNQDACYRLTRNASSIIKKDFANIAK